MNVKKTGDNDDLICPITLQLFQDPVIAGDGHVYEREAITTWIMAHGTSPLTRRPLSISTLQSDRITKRLVDQRRNSTVSFHAPTNIVALPPVRVPRNQNISVASEVNNHNIETYQKCSYAKVFKYIFVALCVGVYLVFPIMGFLTIVED